LIEFRNKGVAMPAKKAKKKAKKAVKKKAPAKKKAKKKAAPRNKAAAKTAKSKRKVVKTKKVTSKKKKEEKPQIEIKGKYLYYFGNGKAEGDGKMKDILGGKGAGLAEMTNTGVPVPPGFTITTDTCKLFYENNMEMPKALEEEMQNFISKLEKSTGMGFGDKKNPLLVSVRSGAKFSMPGMMDTVLNLGLNDETLQGLINKTENERFAYDSYRRFIQMFGNVVLGIDKSEFEEILEKRKKKQRISLDTELTVDDLKYIIKKFKILISDKSGEEFPQDPIEQLMRARDAVFKSWNNPRAITYRHLNDIPSGLGTAVNIQTMVFGNMGDNSATGVGFTRNPSTGQKEFYGEYLTNAQGEDVARRCRKSTNS
jgi:pyruvate,orthophosphate dikinase